MTETAPHTPAQWAYAWIAALRSGRYHQCRRVLSDGRGNFCALGVFGDLAVRHGLAEWNAPIFKRGSRVLSSTAEPDFASAIRLPYPVGDLLDADEFGPVLGTAADTNEPASAAYYNDEKGESFAEIADRVEAWAVEAGLFAAPEDDDGVGQPRVPVGDGILRRPLAGEPAAGSDVTETGDPDAAGAGGDRAGELGRGGAALAGAGVGRGPAGVR